MYNVHVVPEEFSIFLEDTHASKVRFSLIEHIFFYTLTSSRNIRPIITKIYMTVWTQLSDRKTAHKYCVMHILPETVTYNLTIVFLVFREYF